ncbi:MAG: OB-fold nucleic acid binding domain-containing protein [Candidatus Methanosuratincola sp.]|jgi:replication factor A1|nr:OB-fold nucleic acid binding domain-containing protein [Candidatus Methanosuratincola sp.]
MAIKMSNFDGLLKKYKEITGLPDEEILRLIELKKKDLGYLVNDDVALRLVAKENQISLYDSGSERPSLKIDDLVPGLTNVSLKAKILRVGERREFERKDGGIGKVLRVRIADETGICNLVVWDEKTELLSGVSEGCKITITAAYTKTGLNGLEVHLGQKGKIEVAPEFSNSIKGRIQRTFDPIDFATSDGRRGRFVAFVVRGEKQQRVLIWNPSDRILSKLKEGAAVEIFGGTIKKDFNGETELHINNENGVRIDLEDVDDVGCRGLTRLFEIKGEEPDLAVQGIIENDPEIASTQTGRKYCRILLRDQETVVPVVFWNEKAVKIKQSAKPGMLLRIDGCTSRFGPNGLELSVNRWSKIKLG